MKNIYAKLIRVVTFFGFPVSGMLLHNSKRVRVLIQFEDQILLQRTSVGHQKWSVPGGGVEKNENPMAAAIRETWEEVGIILTEDQLYIQKNHKKMYKRITDANNISSIEPISSSASIVMLKIK